MKTIDLTKLYLESGLYERINLGNYTKREIVNILFFDKLLYNQAPTLNCFCTQCAEKVSFSAYDSYNDVLNQLKESNILVKDSVYMSDASREKSFYSTLQNFKIFIRSFKCSNVLDNSHDITFVFKISDKNIFKIGQYPSHNDINTADLKRIRKHKNEAYKELNMAQGLFSHGIGVGSYVYLRRILEKYIVNPKFYKKIEQETLPTEYSSYKFNEKVKYLGEEVSEFLSKNNQVYGFISKGIHELEEEECKQYFMLIYQTIIMILEEEIDIEERKKKKRDIQNQLSKL